METHKSAGLSVCALRILSAGTFDFWHFQEGAMRGLFQHPPLCSHTLPAREKSLAAAPQTHSAEGVLKKKRGVAGSRSEAV